jgi:hypothetical protein
VRIVESKFAPMISPAALMGGEPELPPIVSVDTVMLRTVFGSIRSLAASFGATSNGCAPVARLPEGHSTS